MSGLPTVYFDGVTISGTLVVTPIGTPDVPDPDLPASYLSVDIDRNSVFPNGIAYNVFIDANNERQIAALPANTTFDQEYVIDQVSGPNVTWSGTAPVNIALLSTTFPVLPGQISNSASLGTQIIRILERVITLNGAAAPLDQEFIENKDIIDKRLNESIVAWLSQALTRQIVLDTVLQIMKSYGPVLDFSPGEHAFEFSTGQTEICLLIVIDNVTFKMAYSSGVSDIVLGNIPMVMVLKNETSP